MNTPQIYAVCARGAERYVGKTVGPLRRRLLQHINRAKRGVKTHLSDLIRALLSAGEMPTIVLIDEVRIPEEWGAVEAAYIQFYQEQGAGLTNHTPGGDAGPILLGKDNPKFGVPMTSEQKKKLSIAHTGKVLTVEHRENIGRVNRGVPKTLEHRAKISAAHLGKIKSAAHRAAISATKLGKLGVKKSNNTSGYVGVSWSKKSNRWMARVQFSFIGNFLKKEDAVFARALAVATGDF